VTGEGARDDGGASRARAAAYVVGLPHLLRLELVEGRAWALRAAREAVHDAGTVEHARALARRLAP